MTASRGGVGTWIIEELLRPQNALADSPPLAPPPQAGAAANFFADGNALVSGYGGSKPSL